MTDQARGTELINRTVQVFHLDSNGVPQIDHVHGAPLVRVRFSWQKPYREGVGFSIEGLIDTWALIDTGADTSLLADHLFDGCGPAIQSFKNKGIGGSEQTTSHEVTLLLPPADIMTKTFVIRTSSITADCAYQMILGRNFLMTTRFIYDGPNGIQSLTVLNDKERSGHGA